MSKFYHKDDINRKSVMITEDKETFYKLSDGQMIKKDVFPKYYMPIMNESVTTSSSDFVDPDAFFSLKPDIPFDKLKSIDTSRMKDSPDGATVVKNTANQVRSMGNQPVQNTQPLPPQQFQNESIVRQAPENQPIPNHTNTDVSMYKVYDNDDDAYDDFVKKGQNPQPQSQSAVQQEQPRNVMSEIDILFEDEKMVYGEEEATKRKEKRVKRTPLTSPTNVSGPYTSSPQPIPQVQQEIDPSEIMFKTFKRNHEVTINVTFKDKIGKPDFVKMMIENMEGDIIQFYKKMIMNNIMNNLKHIEDEVEKNLKLEIFGEEEQPLGIDVVEELKKVTKRKVIPKVPKEERSQLNEGTDIKVKKPRKTKTQTVKDESENS